METHVLSKRVLPEDLMTDFSNFLADNLGFYFPKERWDDLEKKFFMVMHSLDFKEPKAFVQWIKTNPLSKDEIAIFARYLTIGETYFLRDSRVFKALKEEVLPDILKHHQLDRKVNIWSAGCCSGEEPYSIAILLHQLLPDIKKWDINILGSDINLEFLSKAENAIYKKWSFRGMPPAILEKYFIQEPDGNYRLIPDIQKLVKFSYVNLVENSYPDVTKGTADLDLILCHNVLIYFSQSQIKKIIGRFAKGLKEHGWLSVSAIESPFVNDPYLFPHHCKGTLFFTKELKPKSPKEIPKPIQTIIPKPPIEPSKPLIEAFLTKVVEPKPPVKKVEKNLYEKCLELSHNKHYTEVIEKLSSFLQPFRKDAGGFLEHLKEVILLIHTYANQGDLTHALEWCKEALHLDKLNPILYYLQGTILQALGKNEEAIKSLTDALFLDPNFIMAHYMLGILEETSKPKSSARHFKIALELTAQHQEEDILPGTDELTAGRLKDLLLRGQHG